MDEAEESMDCSDSEMIPSSPKEETCPEQEDIPEIGRRRGPRQFQRFESYDDMMAMIDDLKAHVNASSRKGNRGTLCRFTF